MPLREGHRARIEPDVDELGGPLHYAAAGAVERDLVDKRLVEIERLPHVLPFAVLVDAPDASLRSARYADPDRQGRPPEPVAREGPVLILLQPVPKPPFP